MFLYFYLTIVNEMYFNFMHKWPSVFEILIVNVKHFRIFLFAGIKKIIQNILKINMYKLFYMAFSF